MRKSLLSSYSCLLLAAGCVLPALGWAQTAPAPERAEPAAPQARSQSSAASLSDAVRRAQRETGGQVLGAERVQYDGRDINRVKVMDDRGRVRYMDDDPQRGPADARRSPASDSQPQSRPRSDNPPRP
ncbi:MAG: PepSY domain-containing protein [Pseudoxanthomonas sp.]|nr:PepSY domain-containing protein [Pseudoxanthomonas sp.]